MDHADIVRLQQLDAEHHLHPFNDNACLLYTSRCV